jgi:formate-dependent nitrite reductase cytochrome c552 subunit
LKPAKRKRKIETPESEDDSDEMWEQEEEEEEEKVETKKGKKAEAAKMELKEEEEDEEDEDMKDDYGAAEESSGEEVGEGSDEEEVCEKPFMSLWLKELTMHIESV